MGYRVVGVRVASLWRNAPRMAGCCWSAALSRAVSFFSLRRSGEPPKRVMPVADQKKGCATRASSEAMRSTTERSMVRVASSVSHLVRVRGRGRGWG